MAVENKRFVIFITATVSFLKGYFTLAYVYMCASVYVYAICVQMPPRSRRHWIPKSWRYRNLRAAQHGCWNSSALSC